MIAITLSVVIVGVHFLRPTSNRGNERSRYAYVCERCQERHEWEGASSGSSLD